MGTDKSFSSYYSESKGLLKEYVEVRVKLLKLQLIKALSRSLGMMFAMMVVSFFAFLVILFLGFSFSAWIATETGNMALGYAAGAGLFFIFLLLVIVLRKPLFMNPLIRVFIREMAADLYESEQHE
jgi:hypothetical protein